VLYESTARRDMQPLQDHLDVPVQLLILKRRLCGLILLPEDLAKGVEKVNLHFPLYLTSTSDGPHASGGIMQKMKKKPTVFSTSSDLTCPRCGAELSASVRVWPPEPATGYPG
jgi:hypothetical protein